MYMLWYNRKVGEELQMDKKTDWTRRDVIMGIVVIIVVFSLGMYWVAELSARRLELQSWKDSRAIPLQ